MLHKQFSSSWRKSIAVSEDVWLWISLVALICAPVFILGYHHFKQQQIESAISQLQHMQERLMHVSTYDLKNLKISGDRLNQLTRIVTKDQQSLKLVSEASVEDRRVREISLAMPQPVSLDERSVLRVLEILQPAAQERPSADIWVKNFKLRKERSGFVMHMSLLKRELK